MKVPAKLKREWDAKLARSGFADLEGATGALSDAGNPHAKHATVESREHFTASLASNGAYHDWATGVLHGLRFKTPLEKRVWAHHAQGDGLRTTATALGITFHAARDAVKSVKARVNRQSGQKGKKEWRRNRLSRQYRKLSMPATIALGALFLRTLTQSLTRRSAS